MTRFLIVRHGQSVWNAAGRWQGRADPPLTALGITQAQHAARALPAFDVLASSTLQRALSTAREIAQSLGTGGAGVTIDRRFMERDAGEFSGLTRPEIEQRFPGYLETGRWPDGWEDHDALLARVQAGLADLAARHRAATIVIISHGGVIYALESLFDVPQARIANLEGRWFASDGDQLTIGDRIHLLDAAEETTPAQL